MKRAKLIALAAVMIALTPVVFVWAWLDEQPAALRMAWLHSFGAIRGVLAEIWSD